MIDFSTLQGLSIPEGVVTQIAKNGVVLWQKIMATDEPPVILEVAKQTATTYAGETKYENEEFILFDIYPKKGGTVKVTYGGLTKTIKDTSGAEEPNAQQVFFGTFNGVSDSVATPTSGRLTIEGAYRGYGLGSFGGYSGKSSGTYSPCVTNVIDMGNPVYIGNRTFYDCTNLALTSLPENITYIGSYAFYNCTNLALTRLPNGLTSIKNYTFYKCSKLALTSLPSGVIYIDAYAFYECSAIALRELPSGLTSIGNYAFNKCANITNIVVPASVTSLGIRCLYCCVGGLSGIVMTTNIRMLGTAPPTMEDEASYTDSGAFGRAQFMEGTITVPSGYADVYKAADVWSHYKEHIVEAS